MHCEHRDGLASQYLRVLDLVDRAKHRLLTSATQTNIECAKTELRRVEDYRHDVLREIAEHCEGHGCGTQKLAKYKVVFGPDPAPLPKLRPHRPLILIGRPWSSCST